MGEPTEGMKRVAEVAGLRERKRALLVKLCAAEAAEAELSARHAETASALSKERADVAALERMSMTRILAGLRGTRDSDLDREQSEAMAAEYAAAEALTRLQGAARDTAGLRTELHGLRDVDAHWEQALALRESELTSGVTGPGAARLAEVLAELAGLKSELLEVNQALDAAEYALQALRRARDKISSAGSWSTYDTFFGGGLFGDMAKYNHLDQAGALMRAADDALRHLSIELADVGLGDVGSVGITSMSRTFDVWFDNIFSDMAVRSRINEAAGRIDHVDRVVVDVARNLGARRVSLVGRVDELSGERERLLAG